MTEPTDDTGNTGSDLEFDCPRCAEPTVARFYGPCNSCVEGLRADHQGQARTVEAAEYEPKMNVTPNAVATKE